MSTGGPYAAVFGQPGDYLGCLARAGERDSNGAPSERHSPHFGPAFAAAWNIACATRLPLSIETESTPDPVVVILPFLGTAAVACWPPIDGFPDREFRVSDLWSAQQYAAAAAQTDGRHCWNCIARNPVLWALPGDIPFSGLMQ